MPGKRKAVHGVGINDADYLTCAGGQRPLCKFYSVWSGMLRRCYSKKFQKRSPSYIGCQAVSYTHLTLPTKA